MTTTLSTFITNTRYDLNDYQSGLRWDNDEILEYINRIIIAIDSVLNSLNSDLLHGTETNGDTTSSQNYINLSTVNNGQWDSIKSVWIGSDRLEQVSVDLMYYKRKFRSSDAKPFYWALEGKQLLFETGADSAHTDVVIHYKKKTRPRLLSWSDTFTGAASTDRITFSPAHTFTTGDGIFSLTTTDTLPAGLSTGTNYYCLFESDGPTTAMQLSLSAILAKEGTAVDITDSGTGTHTATLTEYMPYDSLFDDFIREMIVAYAKFKDGKGEIPIWQEEFRKHAMALLIRRNLVRPEYYIDF